MKTTEKVEFLKQKGFTDDEISALVSIDNEELQATIKSQTNITHLNNRLINSVVIHVKEIATIFFAQKFKHNWKDQFILLGLVFMVLTTVVTLSIMQRIDSTSTATILSSIIGFTIGKYSNGTER